MIAVQPTAAELIDAVIGFIETRAAPQLKDRDAFLAKVAVNALAAVRRELALGAAAEAQATARLRELLGREGGFDDLNRGLCEAIRAGDVAPTDPALLAHLKASLIDQVEIDQPNYSGLRTAKT